MTNDRDFSKYLLFGKTKPYSKGKLVNAVLKAYILKYPKKTYEDLKKDFPDSIQEKLGVFTTKENAEAIYKSEKYKYKRFYMNPKDLIQLEDEIIAACNQWNFHNILVFIEVAGKLGLKIDFDETTLGPKQADKILWIGTTEDYFMAALRYFENKDPNKVINIFKNIHFPNKRKKHLTNLIEKNREKFPKLYVLI